MRHKRTDDRQRHRRAAGVDEIRRQHRQHAERRTRYPLGIAADAAGGHVDSHAGIGEIVAKSPLDVGLPVDRKHQNTERPLLRQHRSRGEQSCADIVRGEREKIATVDHRGILWRELGELSLYDEGGGEDIVSSCPRY